MRTDMTSKKQIPAILPETFEEIVKPWLQGIHRVDITAVMSYPASDRQRRFLNLMDDPRIRKKHLPHSERYIWIAVDFRVELIDDPIDLESTILRKLKKETKKKLRTNGDLKEVLRKLEKITQKKIVLAAFGCENLLKHNRTSILIWFTVMCRQDALRLLLFFETNLLAKEATEILGSVPAFQPRIKVMRLYDRDNTEQFLRYLEQKWSYSVDGQMKDSIVEAGGGVFLLVKEAMWYVRDHLQATIGEVLDHPEMELNLASFWNGFSAADKATLQAIIRHDPLIQNYESSLNYLVSTGIISKSRTQYRITVPLFTSYIKQITTADKNLRFDGRGVYLNDTPIDANFTKLEREIFTFLIQKPNSLITREQIAAIIWPQDSAEKYSDWAIDSHISRLRKKFARLGLDEKMLETVKGKGVIFHHHQTTYART